MSGYCVACGELRRGKLHMLPFQRKMVDKAKRLGVHLAVPEGTHVHRGCFEKIRAWVAWKEKIDERAKANASVHLPQAGAGAED